MIKVPLRQSYCKTEMNNIEPQIVFHLHLRSPADSQKCNLNLCVRVGISLKARRFDGTQHQESDSSSACNFAQCTVHSSQLHGAAAIGKPLACRVAAGLARSWYGISPESRQQNPGEKRSSTNKTTHSHLSFCFC
jgi:hypothetical protein